MDNILHRTYVWFLIFYCIQNTKPSFLWLSPKADLLNIEFSYPLFVYLHTFSVRFPAYYHLRYIILLCIQNLWHDHITVFITSRRNISTWKKRHLKELSLPTTDWNCRLQPRNYYNTWAYTAQGCESERIRPFNRNKSDVFRSKELSGIQMRWVQRELLWSKWSVWKPD